MRISNTVAALSLSGALVLGAQAPACAAPLTALSVAAKPADQGNRAVQVRFGGWRGGGWRGGGWGWGVGGLAAGALIGAAIASPYYYGGGPDPYYAYAGYPYGYAGPGYGAYGYRSYGGYGPYWRHRPGWYGGWGGWGPGW
jgi:hypothetical protein